MGIYEIQCPQCKKPHLWFSGVNDQRCGECMQANKPLIPERLSQIKARLSAATPGPFVAYERGNSMFREFEIRHNGGVLFRSTSYGRMQEDTELLGHARQDIPDLVAALEIAIEALKDAQDTICSEFCGSGRHHPLCDRPREALAKIENLMKNKEQK